MAWSLAQTGGAVLCVGCITGGRCLLRVRCSGLLGPPILLFAWLVNKHDLVYPWALFGARAWLRLSGVRVRVKGLELLDPKQTYVFVSNHRSYLDTAAMFIYTGRRIGLLAKKELLKVPVLGVGMGFVNVMAIDRSNRESAIRTTEAAAQRIQVRCFVCRIRRGNAREAGRVVAVQERRVLHGPTSGRAGRACRD